MIWGWGIPPVPSLSAFMAEFAVVLAKQTISISKNQKEWPDELRNLTIKED